MMRIFAWIAASLAVASAQVVPEGKQTKAKAVPVEASAAIRKSLATCQEPKIHDVLPDPAKYPKLHAAEAEAARQNSRLGKIGGYPCYDVNADYGRDRIQPILDILSASASLQMAEGSERFWPEKVISWGKGDQVRHVALSTKTEGVVFLNGGKQMRYALTPEAVKKLRSIVGDMQFMRPDAVEEAAPLLDALKQGAELAIHEGIPRFGSGVSHEEALKLRGEWLIDGFQFLKTGTVDHDTKVLRDLLLKEGALIPWRGIKMCGAFNPDFAITWKVAERDVSLLVWFGCHEAMFVDPEGNLLYDLPGESYQALKAELEKFRPIPVGVSREK